MVTRRKIAAGVALLGAYALTAKIGLGLYAVNDFATLIWPPTGIAIAGLLLGGRGLWPAVTLGAFLTNLSVGASPLVAIGIAIGNTLEAVIGAYFLRRYIDFDQPFSHLRDNLGIILVALCAPIVSASIGVNSLLLGGVIPVSAFWSTWAAWWVGDALGAIIFTPLLLLWFSGPPIERTISYLARLTGSLALLFGGTVFIFWTPYFPFPYPLIIPLALLALQTGPRGITLGFLVMSLTAISATLVGSGPFAYSNDIIQGILLLQTFIGIVSLVFLIFTSVVEERKNVIRKLEGHVSKLNQTLTKNRFEDQAKNEFLAILAHELRNPLSPVLSSLEFLKLRGMDTPDAPDVLEVMNNSVRSMARLLDDLLDISRISQKKLKLQPERVAVREALQRVIRSVEPFINGKNQILSVSLPPSELWIYADPVRFEQIVMNILFNAAKYTGAEGTIALTLKKESQECVISVKDTGTGIDPSMLKEVFNPFIQVHEGPHGKSGLGIGLSITKRLVEMHKGKVEAQSEGIGRGSEFIVRLPLPSSIQLSALSTLRDRNGRYRKELVTTYDRVFNILIVDDNKAAAHGLKKLLELKHHTVFLAYDGGGALKAVRTFSPDIILLDIGLPDLDGYEVAKKIRAEFGISHSLIAITGYGQEEDKRKATLAGFNYHLVKPVGMADLESVFKNIPEKENAENNFSIPNS